MDTEWAKWLRLCAHWDYMAEDVLTELVAALREHCWQDPVLETVFRCRHALRCIRRVAIDKAARADGQAAKCTFRKLYQGDIEHRSLAIAYELRAAAGAVLQRHAASERAQCAAAEASDAADTATALVAQCRAGDGGTKAAGSCGGGNATTSAGGRTPTEIDMDTEHGDSAAASSFKPSPPASCSTIGEPTPPGVHNALALAENAVNCPFCEQFELRDDTESKYALLAHMWQRHPIEYYGRYIENKAPAASRWSEIVHRSAVPYHYNRGRPRHFRGGSSSPTWNYSYCPPHYQRPHLYRGSTPLRGHAGHGSIEDPRHMLRNQL